MLFIVAVMQCRPYSSSCSSVDIWTQVVDLYVQSVVYQSEYRTIRVQ